MMVSWLIKIALYLVVILIALKMLEWVCKRPIVFFGIIITAILLFLPIDDQYAGISGIITVVLMIFTADEDGFLNSVFKTSSEDLEEQNRAEEERERIKEEEDRERIRENDRLVRNGFAYKLGRSELRELDDEPNSNLSSSTRDWLDENRDEYDSDF